MHFNPDYPENQNLRAIANHGVPKKTIAVFENDRWTMREDFFVLRQIIQTYVLTMKQRVSQEDFRKRVAPEEWFQIWNRLSSFNIDDNPNDVCAVFRDIHNMMSRVEKVYIENM